MIDSVLGGEDAVLFRGDYGMGPGCWCRLRR